jgi:hypothetical protein
MLIQDHQKKKNVWIQTNQREEEICSKVDVVLFLLLFSNKFLFHHLDSFYKGFLIYINIYRNHWNWTRHWNSRFSTSWNADPKLVVWSL